MFINTMKTGVLLAGLGGLIVAVAGILGGGSSSSLVIGLALALVMVGGSYWFSDKLALKAGGAQKITREQAPEFYDMIARLAERAKTYRRRRRTQAAALEALQAGVAEVVLADGRAPHALTAALLGAGPATRISAGGRT